MPRRRPRYKPPPVSQPRDVYTDKPVTRKIPPDIPEMHELPEPEVTTKDVSLHPEESVTVVWERPGGQLVTVGVKAKRLSGFESRIKGEGGRIVSATTQKGETFYESPTTGEYKETVKSYYQTQYEKHGYRAIPQKFKQDIGDMPEIIDRLNLEKDYTDVAYRLSIGTISEWEANKYLNELISKSDIAVDSIESTKSYKDTGPSVEGFLSFLFVGKPEYAYASLTGPTWQPSMPIESKQMQQIRIESEQRWRSSDIWGKLGYTFTSPLVFPVAAHFAVKGFGMVARFGIRGIVRTTPKVVSKFKTVFPGGLVTESGKVVGSPTIIRLHSGIGAFGRTPFWRTTYGWSTKELVRVKTLPMKYPPKTKVVDVGVGKIRTTLRTYKGFGKTEWVPRGVVEQALRAETFHIHKYTAFGTRYQSFTTEMVYKPRGLFWKTFRKQVTVFTEKERLVIRPERADLYSGIVKFPTGKKITALVTKKDPVGFWKDVRAYQTLAHPVHARPMIHTSLHHMGYVSEAISIPSIGTLPSVSFKGASLVATALISGVGLTRDIGNMYKPTMKSAQRYALDTLQTQLSGFDTVQSQLTRQFQQQRQIQMPKLIYKTALTQSFVSMPSIVSPPHVIPKTPAPFRVPTPIIVPPVDKGYDKRMKMFLKGDLFGKGWRKRIWFKNNMELI